MKEEADLKSDSNELKRKWEGEVLPSVGKKKQKNSQPKNALMILNEWKPGLDYILESREGPPHNPTFIISVEVNGQKFTGQGHSKQLAKRAAAESALIAVGRIQNTSKDQKSLSECDSTPDLIIGDKENVNFAQFEKEKQSNAMTVENLGKIEKASSVEENQKDNLLSKDSDEIQPKFQNEKTSSSDTDKQNNVGVAIQSEEKMKSKNNLLVKDLNKTEKAKTEIDGKNPVMLLNEMHLGIEYNLVSENLSVPAERFKMSVVINGITFEGVGPSKSLAKAATARSALSNLYGIGSETSLNNASIPETFIFPQSIADKISSTIHKTYEEIMANNADCAKWKVLAGIVMTLDAEMSKMKIVGICTGTKCINGKNISMNGACLNDCHAEILVRRCLKNFFYYNLKLIAVGQKDDSIFTENETGGYRLRSCIKFHLYITTAPCGDARNLISEVVRDRHSSRKIRGCLRSKVESREDTIPITAIDGVQSWDAIINGRQKLITLSCSDKIAAWNVLGIQGALLSCFIEPVYLESIIFGSIIQPGHIFQVMWGRFENSLKELPKPYQLKKPKMCCTTNPAKSPLSKSPNFSVNWTVGFGRPEIINAVTGKLKNGEVSHLSKRSFFGLFSNLYGKISSIANQNTNKEVHLYSQAKNFAVHYQMAKQELKKAFKMSGLGVWVQKPEEQDDFSLGF